MGTIERKAKFNKSKATYRKRDKRKKEKPEFSSMRNNKELIMGIKTKAITNNLRLSSISYIILQIFNFFLHSF